MKPYPTLLLAAIGVTLSSLPAQTARFQQPTDTIRLQANTVLGSEATIEAHVYLDGATSGGTLFNEWTDGAEDKRLVVGPFLIEGYGLLSQGAVSSNAPVPTDRWHHVAYVYGQSQQRLYLDGVLVATHPATGSFSNHPSGLGHLGGTPHPGLSGFRGFLESFRVSSVARYSGASFAPPPRNMSSDAATLVLYTFDEPAGSTTVVDSSGNGNHGTLGSGFAGATPPALGIRLMTCERAPGGQLNSQPIDAMNGRIVVAPGAVIQGTVNLRTYNDMHPGAVAPLAGTANWGVRTAQYWTVHPWIATGDQTYGATVNVTAPTQSGSYYLIFGFSGMYGADQVMSSTHPAIAAIWNDGNDVGFDWSAPQLAAAVANGGAVAVEMRMPSLTLTTSLQPFTAVRVDVGSPAAVVQLGAGCAGSSGVPLLQSSLPVLGTTAVLHCQNLVPGLPAFIALGLSNTDWNGAPLPLDLGVIGMPGCALRVRPDNLLGGLQPGFLFAGFSIPNQASWLGARVFAQAIAFDPPVNPFGAVLSNALELRVGY